MKRKTIKIPAPIANHGDLVWVHNYRIKKKDKDGDLQDANVWERGQLRGLEYRNSFGSFRWTYDVFLSRGVSLHVADDGISKTRPS